MQDLNQKRWPNTSENLGWDSIEAFMRQIILWERENQESLDRVNNGTNYAHDIPYIVRGQNFIQKFSAMVDGVLSGS
jgi:hypothetical protein